MEKFRIFMSVLGVVLFMLFSIVFCTIGVVTTAQLIYDAYFLPV